MQRVRRILRAVVTLWVVLAVACGCTPAEVDQPFESDSPVQAQIDAAIRASRADNRRVLLVFGANWCRSCRRLEHVIRNHSGVRRILDEHYRVVHVNVGDDDPGPNADVIARYGNATQNGIPAFVVLDDEGRVADMQDPRTLKSGIHSPAKIAALLADARDRVP